jgi:hypothetical protein
VKCMDWLTSLRLGKFRPTLYKVAPGKQRMKIPIKCHSRSRKKHSPQTPNWIDHLQQASRRDWFFLDLKNRNSKTKKWNKH